VSRSISKRLLRRFHSRSHTHTTGDVDTQVGSTLATSSGNVLPVRTKSRREKIVHVIANPDTLFKQVDSPKEERSR
jgi:hypothetical protein